MGTKHFTPHHMNVTAADLAGNDGIGRYILLPGSDGRAASIAEHFSGREVREHPRRHNVYLGTLDLQGETVDVATVATGMGCPSVDIIVNELVRLGARRLLRVGTAGSLQPDRITVGSVVIASAAVRDEGTSRHYMPPEIPAVASPLMIAACERACAALGVRQTFTGIVHTKDSLFARELRAGPMVEENERFMDLLRKSGVLASEMESAMLFTLAQVLTQEILSGASWAAAGRTTGRRRAGTSTAGGHPAPAAVEAGTVLAIIGDETAFADRKRVAETTERAVEIGLETVRQRARADREAPRA